jgi:hypothetical protein
MDKGQEKFFEFMIKRAQPGKETELKEFLAHSFNLVGAGKADAAFFTDFNAKLKDLVKPEFVAEIISVTKQFQAGHQ